MDGNGVGEPNDHDHLPVAPHGPPTLITGLALRLGRVGLAVEPGSASWWAARSLWLSVYSLALVFGLFERGGGGPPAAAWRQVAGAVFLCGGLALLAREGIGGVGWLGLRWWAVLLPFAGAALGGLNLLATPQRAGSD